MANASQKTHPQLAPVRASPAAQPLLDALEHGAALLAGALHAPARIEADPGHVSARRQTAVKDLFAACVQVRQRIKSHFRGPSHLELRRAFGLGLPATAAKPKTVLALAHEILSAAPRHLAALREVEVDPPTLERIEALCLRFHNLGTTRLVLRATRLQADDELAKVAERVNRKGQTLVTHIRHVCRGQDLSFLPRLRG